MKAIAVSITAHLLKCTGPDDCAMYLRIWHYCVKLQMQIKLTRSMLHLQILDINCSVIISWDVGRLFSSWNQ